MGPAFLALAERAAHIEEEHEPGSKWAPRKSSWEKLFAMFNLLNIRVYSCFTTYNFNRFFWGQSSVASGEKGEMHSSIM